MSFVGCGQCGITPAEVGGSDAELYFTDTPSGVRCTTCILWGARLDHSSLTQILVAANRARRKAEDRLRLAEDCASLFRDHLHGCVDTPRETDALTEWEYAAGVKPVPDGADDYPRAEDMA